MVPLTHGCIPHTAPHNFLPGVFVPHGQHNYGVTDARITDPTIAFRYLLRFDGLAKLLPAGATVLSAKLTLNFVNWQPTPMDILGCYQTKAWQDTAVGPP